MNSTWWKPWGYILDRNVWGDKESKCNKIFVWTTKEEEWLIRRNNVCSIYHGEHHIDFVSECITDCVYLLINEKVEQNIADHDYIQYEIKHVLL